ncbi:MAG: hypothetical protein AAFX53_16330 [Bacteroidota bacterium]
MQKLFFILLCLFFLNSCSFTEKPEFVRIDRVDILQADLGKVVLQADAVFLNHNHLGGTLHTDNIDVLVDEQVMAQVSSETFEVPRKEEFTIPLSVRFNTAKLLEGNNSGILGSVLNQMLNKKINVRFKGEIGYTVLGFSSSYALDHSEDILIDY